MLLPFLAERQVASDLVELLARLQLSLKQALPKDPHQGEASMLFVSPPLSVLRWGAPLRRLQSRAVGAGNL
jgi:hypothetical protein